VILKNLKDLTTWFENLKEESLDEIGLFYDEDVFFKDPFNEIEGKDKLIKIFEHMFENLVNPHFVIIDTIENSDGAFLTWDFFSSIKGREHKIHGSSHLKYNGESRIIYHRDYWDVGEEILLNVPFIKLMYSYFRKKMALPKEYLC
jgi:steroid delta-isomerase